MTIRTIALITLALVLGACETAENKDDLSQQEPNHELARTYQELAVVYLRQGAMEIALGQANRALELDPNFGLTYNVLGLIYQKLGQNEKAEESYKTALEKDPNNSYIHNAYGTFLCRMGRYDESILEFEQALKNPLYRTPEVSQTNAGLCALSANRQADAERLLRASLKNNRRQPSALMAMAKIGFKNYKFLSVRAYLQRFHEQTTPTAESLWMGIRAERRLGDEKAVEDYARKLVRQYPDSVETSQYYDSITVGQ